jgi:hypothetical protein
MDSEPYVPGLAVVPFGLHNTGVICHLNALLQALISCTSFTKAVGKNREFMARTETGRALYDYVMCALTRTSTTKSRPSYLTKCDGVSITGHSARVLDALVHDLRERRPTVRYGPSQESASEGLALLLDMLIPVGVETEHALARVAAKKENKPMPPPMEPHPISRLFYHRYEEGVYCAECEAKVSSSTDSGVQFNMFHYDQRPPATPTEFSEILRDHVVKVSKYRCGRCARLVDGFRHYLLSMIPEILVISFNQYQGKRTRYAPKRLPFPGIEKGTRLMYRQVAQVMHSGTLGGGHYTAYGLRRGGKVYHFNDSSYSPAQPPSSTSAYLVFYHFETMEGGGNKVKTCEKVPSQGGV